MCRMLHVNFLHGPTLCHSFNSLDVSVCLAHLPKFFNVCMNCLLAEKEAVSKAATSTMKVGRYFIRDIIVM